jgi:hypothetical protein
VRFNGGISGRLGRHSRDGPSVPGPLRQVGPRGTYAPVCLARPDNGVADCRNMSIAVRRSLARQLNQLRLSASKSVADVDQTKIVSKTKLLAIEGAERKIKVSDVMSLCLLYGADPETSARLAKMALNDEKGWWEDFSDVVNPRFRFFVELESAADRVFTYDAELLYGLLQTPAYHRAIFEVDPNPTVDYADRQVQFRAERQKATLGRTAPLHVTAILNEAILLRQVGGEDVMAEQRDHLLRLSRQPNVGLYVVPWEAGAHAAMSGPFKIVSFDAPNNPDVVYLETSLGVRYVEEDDRLQMYRDRFDRVRAHAIPLEEYMQ